MSLNILVVNHNADDLNKMLGIIAGEEDWAAEGTTNDEKAIEDFHSRQYDLVVLSGIDKQTEARLVAIFRRLNQQINILLYAGGDDWFLKAQINTIMGMSGEQPDVVDNPFS